MMEVIRNIAAVIAGIVIGSVVNMAIITVGPLIIPPPEGVDMSDMDKFADNLKLLSPKHYIAPWLAHAVGTLAGAFITAKVAGSHKLALAIGIGVFFLLGGVAMVLLVGGPTWFIAADLIGAYIPMGFLGGKLASPRKPTAV